MLILFTIAEFASGVVICSRALRGKDVSEGRRFTMQNYNNCPIDRTQYSNFRLKINKFSTANYHESTVRLGVDVGWQGVLAASYSFFEVAGKTSYFTSSSWGNPLYLSSTPYAETVDSIQVWASCIDDWGWSINQGCEFDFDWQIIADTAPPPPSPSPPPLPPSPGSDNNNNNDAGKKNNLGLIVGIVAIAAVAIAALALAAFCYLKKKKKGAVGHAVATPVGLAVNMPPKDTNQV